MVSVNPLNLNKIENNLLTKYKDFNENDVKE